MSFSLMHRCIPFRFTIKNVMNIHVYFHRGGVWNPIYFVAIFSKFVDWMTARRLIIFEIKINFVVCFDLYF